MSSGCYMLHWESSRMSWLLRQELLKSQGASTVVLLTLALPGGTKRYAMGPGVALLGTGQHESKLLELGTLSRAMSDRTGSMTAVEYEAVIDDTDGSFSALYEGADRRSIRGSAATRVLGSPNVPSGHWFTTFAGVIDRYSLDGPKRWRISVRPNDLAMVKGFYPKPLIDKSDWPNAPEASLAQFGPLLYGKHDSGTGGKGAVPLVLVDSTANKYLLCWGRAQGVDNTFADGAAPSGTWSVSHPTTNSGRLCTIVTFSVSQGSKAIAADVRGYEATGDGTGALIENPADQIKHLLVNWVFGDYKTGLWLADSTAPIDVNLFLQAKLYFDRFAARGSRRLFSASQGHGDATLDEWAKSTEAKLFWTSEGNVGVSMLAPQVREIHSDYAYLRYDDSQRRGAFPINLQPDWESLRDRVDLQYNYSEVQGKYVKTLSVRDPTLNFEAPDSLALPWSAAY